MLNLSRVDVKSLAIYSRSTNLVSNRKIEAFKLPQFKLLNITSFTVDYLEKVSSVLKSIFLSTVNLITTMHTKSTT